MPIKILMPALSPTMKEGNLAKWLKKEGDKVKPGDIIAEIETDKATMEMEVVDEGILAKIIIPTGTENVPIHSLIAILLEEGEDERDLAKYYHVEPDEEFSGAHETVTLALHDQDTRILVSPLAKRIAAEKNIDLSSITGTGPHGRIVKADVEACPEPLCQIGASRNNNTIIPHSNVRKIIAGRLLQSKQTIPHFYLSIECKIDKLLDLRTEMNAASQDHYKISVNDFVIKASALALADIPEANASWDDKAMILYGNVDIAVAVATTGGLVTPVLRNADHKTLISLSNEIKALAARARDNKLKPEEFQGGGFTISNLGMYGVKNFSAIINPPQSCILAVGEGSKRAIVEGCEIKIATIMDVTLSCDHRAVDGAIGAKFLASFQSHIENPVKMLIKEMI